MEKKLDTAPYKGVRDFYPEDMRRLKHMFETIRGVVEKFGYVEYGASILEPAELYRAKSGEEIVNEQTYTFVDRGDREVTLRPEMTPTVARMVARKKRDLGFPLRWYSIPNLFRYESPQRGRLREHYQLNVDIFGVSDVSGDLEIIQVAHSIMKAFGAKDSDFEIRINSRKLIENSILPKLKSPDLYNKAVRLIDRKEKLSPEEFEKKWAEISDEAFALNVEPNDLIKEITSSLQKLGVTNAVFSPTLMRGFDYYTDVVFEIFDTNQDNRRSLFGGGRYDNLLELFGGDSVPAVGFGMGDVTLTDFLETHNLLPSLQTETKAVLASVGPVNKDEVMLIANSLREKGLSIGLNLTAKKPTDAIKSALKQAVKWIIFVGDNELAEQKYTLKNLTTEETLVLSLEDIASKLKPTS